MLNRYVVVGKIVDLIWTKDRFYKSIDYTSLTSNTNLYKLYIEVYNSKVIHKWRGRQELVQCLYIVYLIE